MRQVKQTPRHPDFKHKASGEGLWLTSAPAEVQQLVSQWDANQSAGSSQPSVMLPEAYLWKSLFEEPTLWFDKRPTKNNRPAFVHRHHHYPLWLGDRTPVEAIEHVQRIDDLNEGRWVKEQLGVKVGKAAANSEDSESEEEEEDTDEGGAAKEEDESDKWSQEGRQQAVEALLGSCAGNDFAEESEALEGSMTVELLPHQKRALAWMLHREQPGTKPPVAGGLLADDQGLGKTVTAIALLLRHPPDEGWRSRIAGGDLSLPGQCERWPAGTQLDSIYGPEGSASFVMDSPHLPTCTHTDVVQQASASDASTDGAGEEAESFEQLGGTLVVAPPSVVKAVWARELASKVSGRCELKVAVHHGMNRETDAYSLAQYDVVITSYATLRSEHRQPEAVGLYQVRWWRVLLDEAQNIKNCKAQRTAAVFDLKAKYRWALSGTPIQNHVIELFSYFRFLQYHPFNTQAAFEQYIRRVEQMPNPEHALERLREMLRPVMLRRTKDTTFESAPILDKAAERDARAALLNSIRPEGSKIRKASSMPAVFAVLVRLRQACTHFSLLPPEMQLAWPSSSDSGSDDTEGTTGSAEDTSQGSTGKPEGKPEEAKGKEGAQTLATRLHNIQTRRGQSTKINRVLRIIQEAQQRPEGPQKVIVFSTFVQALHIMADTLAHSKLGFVMLHGQMDLDERSQAIDRFRQEPETVVLLASMLASGTGITVTCASEVVLMEPYWNPFAENQAIDRVHRIGQEHDVTVHKLFMAGTVEEKIMELQERKIKLLGAIIEQTDATTLKAKGGKMTEADWNALLS
ncbi:hypothetical protein ABBQ38_010470 [Trebouxia sp. C0009 RCD-2024]